MFLSKMLRAVDHPYIVGPGGRKVRANSVAKNSICVLFVYRYRTLPLICRICTVINQKSAGKSKNLSARKTAKSMI
jgi:hypothetical protein